MLKAYPKILALGSKPVAGILSGYCEVTEKIDGSQFCFGRNVEGELFFRSKGALIFAETVQKLFAPAVAHVLSISEKIPTNIAFYGETLCSPRHNVLRYNTVPQNHIVLFGVMDFGREYTDEHGAIEQWGKTLDVDVAPVLMLRDGVTVGDLDECLERESYLGGPNIEGVVVKRFEEHWIGGQLQPLMVAKLVSTIFKEVHSANWANDHKPKNKWEDYKLSFCTEARWQKAVQHLDERGDLAGEAKDIGALMKEINIDIEAEEKEAIKDKLWSLFGKEVLRVAGRGFPEWYKTKLMETEVQ